MAAERQTPRWKAISQQLRQEVKRYEYGSRFYTIADICEKFDVSSITARRVLSELAADGLVERIPRRGTVTRYAGNDFHVRILIPSEAGEHYPNYTESCMRKFVGVTSAASKLELDYAPIPESDVVMMFKEPRPEFGFIIPMCVTWQTIEFLEERKLPFVMLDPEEKNLEYPHATCDRIQAGYESVMHLIDHGHKRIAYLLGHVSSKNFRDRLTGYRKGLKKAGIKFDWELVRESNAANVQENYWQLHRLFQLKDPPTAIITGDDERAMHVLSYCKKEGIDVPGQFSVLGYPNYSSSALTTPPLSVLDAQFEKVGEAAVTMLLELMAGKKLSKQQQAVKVSPLVLQRETTAAAPTGNKKKTSRKRAAGKEEESAK